MPPEVPHESELGVDVERSFTPKYVIPKDKRSIFVVNWGDLTYAGTTDTDYDGPIDAPRTEPGDVEYVLGVVTARAVLERLTPALHPGLLKSFMHRLPFLRPSPEQQESERHALARALGDIARATWCFEHGGAIDQGDVFARITGWTADREKVVRALEGSDARALATFPRPPRGAHAPLVLRNPWWAQPFEVFTRLVGMPGATGADPSVLLALAVPLMFGYMFGDVGQGALLALGGLVLSRRFAIARLFVAGGVSAMAFGTLFGSVFGLHGVIAPLWIDPLDAPLRILLVPLAGGAMLLVVGLALGALEAFWRREFVRWLASDAAVAVAYVALIAGLLEADAFAIAAIAALWFCAGHAALARRASESLVAAGELAERLFQLGVNSLSFARVGAFALAHAGLSSAIVALMRASDDPALRLLVLVAGNAIVIALEALVVSIQTTRLVLFEFFTRFLVAEGRLFRPLAPPPFAQET